MSEGILFQCPKCKKWINNRDGIICEHCGYNVTRASSVGQPSTPPAQPLEAKPVQPCAGMPHYYCINPSCQWVAHFKPVERKCPKCGNTVWKEGATTLQHKSVPLCEADHAPSSSAMPDKPYLTALRIMLEGRSGAAQNAVRGDYPEMAAIVDQHRSSASEYESASEWYVRMGFTVIAFGLDEAFTLAERYAAERRVR